MNALKSTASWLSLYLVTTLFFITAVTYGFFAAISADSIKDTLKDENIYDKIVPAVLATAKYDSASTEAGQIPLSENWVQEAVKKAFTADDLEQKTSTAVDGTFAWLEGDTATPQFTIDFSGNKQALGEQVGNYAKTRLESLPPCTSASQIPASVDAYRISCLPPGVNPSVVANTVKSDIVTSDQLLKDTVLTPEDLNTNVDNEVTGVDAVTNTTQTTPADPAKPSENLFDKLNPARDLFKNRNLLQILLPVLTVLAAVSGVMLAKDRPTGIKRLYRSLFAAAIGLLIFFLLMKFGLEKSFETLQKDAISKDVVAPIFTSLLQKTEKVYLIFSIVGVVVGSALVFTNKRLARHS